MVIRGAASVVNILELKFKLLLAFEVVRYSEAGLEVWVQVVHDSLRLADLLPRGAFLLVEDALRVRLAEHVQVLQFAA